MSGESFDLHERPFAPASNRRAFVDVLFVLALPIACLLLNPGILELGSLGILSAHWGKAPAYFLATVLFLTYWLEAGPSLPDHWRGMQLGAVILGLVMSGALAVVLVPFALLSLPDALDALGLLLQSGPLSPGHSGTPAAITAILPLLGLATTVTLARYYARYRALKRENRGRNAAWRAVPLGLAAPLALAILVSVVIETLFAGVS